MTAREIHHQGVFARDPHRCRLRLAELGPCRGNLQADHILKISALRRWQGQLQLRATLRGEKLPPAMMRFARVDLDVVIADPRNGWILCRLGHHAPKDQKQIPTEKMINRWPHEFFGFVDEYGLGPLLHSEFGVSDPAPRLRGHGRPGDAFADWIR